MDDSRSRSAPAVVFWAGAIVLVALVLGVSGMVRSPGGGEPQVDPATVRLPDPLEPEGELDEPPRVFRWARGGEDSDWAQVVIYRASLERLWESPPLHGTTYEIDIQEAFRGIPAGEPCVWRVREVRAGRPRASSRLAEFSFTKDHRGFGVGEAPAESRFVTD